MSDGIKLGQLLCDADIITKRQLSKALAEQVKGRKGTIGEILVEMGFCSFDDITDTLMNSSADTQKHEEKSVEIHPEPEPVIEAVPKSVVCVGLTSARKFAPSKDFTSLSKSLPVFIFTSNRPSLNLTVPTVAV